ncbi:MAG: peptidoglycan-binding protein [Proteobacteria bacterium]|nr:peptidoglycan-binding protein [Pseudomonadota bacterium]
MNLGATGEDVEALQEFLKQFPDIYPEGLVTGYFGPLTENAVKNFQKKNGIVNSGSPETTGFGQVGPKTRSKLNELVTEGAGDSGVVPPGLSVALGIQSSIATSSESTTLPPTTATSSVSAAATSTTPEVTPPVETPTVPDDTLPTLITDDFNSYSDGNIVGQGGWVSFVNGNNVQVQGVETFEGSKALHVNKVTDSIVTKATGTPLSDGRQTFYVRSDNRPNWGPYLNGNLQIRVSKGSWGSGGAFAAVTLDKNGDVSYFNPTADIYEKIASYSDNEWTRIEIEWRSTDNTARYSVNSGEWTSWKVFAGSAAFTNFDNVGFEFFIPKGSGGAYFDALQ